MKPNIKFIRIIYVILPLIGVSLLFLPGNEFYTNYNKEWWFRPLIVISSIVFMLFWSWFFDVIILKRPFKINNWWHPKDD